MANPNQLNIPAKLPKRVVTPTLIQMEAVECGAASLGIVERFYGLWHPLEKLRVDCGISRDGSNLLKVAKAARGHGMEARGRPWDMGDVYAARMPVILHWNFNHFLVLEGFKGSKVYINDPGTGPRVISHEELNDSFTGRALEIHPSETFVPEGKEPSVLKALKERMKGSEVALAFVLVCGFFLVIPGLLTPSLARFFVDEILVGGNSDWIVRLLAGMGLVLLLNAGLTWLQQSYLLRLQTRLALTASARFFHHVLRLPAAFFAQRFAGEIGSRVAINDNIAGMIAGPMIMTLLNLVLITFYGALMLTYNWMLASAAMILTGVNVIFVKIIGRKRADATRKLLQESGKLGGTAVGGLNMIETLKATGGEGEFFERWAGYHAKSLRAEQDLSILGNVTSSVPAFVDAASNALILGAGALLVMNGEMTVGMLVAFQALFGRFAGPVGDFVEFGNAMQELKGDMSRVDDVLRYPKDPQYLRTYPKRPELESRVRLSGLLEFKNVEFKWSEYDRDPFIRNFNLVVKPGQRVAIVGGSGSGKSTVAKLLSGVLVPSGGEILLDGVPKSEIPPAMLFNSMSIIDQEVTMFEGTVRDNLTLWDRTIPDSNIVRACLDASIEKDILERPGGYNSRVVESGRNFSGGQRQRLEIARALVSEPTILVMDEATSALDNETEKHVDGAVRRRGCSALIVAHRLSTVKDADIIVVMRAGQIVEMGRHDQLTDLDWLAENGFAGAYRELIKE